MKNSSKILLAVVVGIMVTGVFSAPVSAEPTFQVFSPDWVSHGTLNEDQDTWFVIKNPFELWVIGAHVPTGVTALTNVTLLLSVPDGQTGSISITGNVDPIDASVGVAADPVLLTHDPAGINPEFDATADIIGVDTGFNTTDFLPDKTDFNNHWPLQDGVSDFLIYDLGSFDDLYRVRDYNADDGTMELASPRHMGQVKSYTIGIDGFDSVHFDAYGTLIFGNGIEELTDYMEWRISPGSHDVTFIPAPGAVLLGSIGVGLIGWLRRRRLF